MKNKYYVYALLDPRKVGEYSYGEYYFKFEPFYIGKGCGNRISRHFSKYSINLAPYSHKNNKINKILRYVDSPIEFVKIYQDLDEKEALTLETHVICTIGRADLNDGPLTNMTNGGEERGQISVETRKKISKANKGRASCKKGSTISESTKKLIFKNNAKYWLGKNYSDERKKQMSEISKKQDFSWRNKTYKLTDPLGNVYVTKNLKEFCLIYDLTRSKMSSVASGKRNHHKQWTCEYYSTP